MFKFLNQWAPLAGLSTSSLESGIAAIRDKVCSFIAMNIKRFETERLQVLAFAISHGFLYYDRDFGYYKHSSTLFGPSVGRCYAIDAIS